MTDLNKIRAAQVRAAEQAVIDGLPPELLAGMTTETQAPDPAHDWTDVRMELEAAGRDDLSQWVACRLAATPAHEGAQLPPLPENPDADDWTNGQADAIEEWGRSAIAAALAAPAPQAPAWQPIETAPRDGSDVLLFEIYERLPVIGWWCQRQNRWYASTEVYDTDGDATVIDKLYTEGVTHWMPLPAAPQTKEQP